jgi:beta-mannanase
MSNPSRQRFFPRLAALLFAAGMAHLFAACSGRTLTEENGLRLAADEPILATFPSLGSGLPHKVDSVAHFRLRVKGPDGELPDLSPLRAVRPDVSLLLTVEPWGNALFPGDHFKGLLAGEYDSIFAFICGELPQDRDNVFVRFAPEMEVPTKISPWQYQAPETYINAYRHFAKICAEHAPRAQRVWAPAGYPGALEYCPGDEVVELASVTVHARSEIGLDAYPRQPVAYDLFRRLHRLRFLQVPVLVLGADAGAKEVVNQGILRETSARILDGDDVYSLPIQAPGVPTNLTDAPSVAPPLIGLYDPGDRLNAHPAIGVEHLFADFASLADGRFANQFTAVLDRGNEVIVSFEPFRLPDGTTDSLVLQNVTKGQYDQQIADFYNLLATTERTIYLRYAHEMEIPIHRYPWQSQDPLAYIRSYRYFMRRAADSPNIHRVWGPAGDRGSLEWYPGDEWVDYLSIAIYGLPDKNITDPKKQEAFATIFNRKTWRLRFVDKPLFITEFGVKGPEAYQTAWLLAAARRLRKATGLKGINYFNMSDTPGAWGDVKPPDWSITAATLEAFVGELGGTR